jgi:hypothetical protein
MSQGTIAILLMILTPPPATTRALPANPIEHRHVARRDPPLHMHVVTIDLTDPRVRLRVCRGGDDPDGPDGPWQSSLQTVREVAAREKLHVAINANFFTAKESAQIGNRRVPYFAGNPARVTGLAMSNGELWSDTPSGASLVVDSSRKVSIDRYTRDTLPADARQVVSGSEMIVTDETATVTTAPERAPRTAVGINRDGSKLILLVVDGRKLERSAGMTGHELAKELIDLGCWRALNLDGGGSSTLVMLDPVEREHKVLNHPSDGHDLPIPLSLERPVANVLGVTFTTDN